MARSKYLSSSQDRSLTRTHTSKLKSNVKFCLFPLINEATGGAHDGDRSSAFVLLLYSALYPLYELCLAQSACLLGRLSRCQYKHVCENTGSRGSNHTRSDRCVSKRVKQVAVVAGGRSTNNSVRFSFRKNRWHFISLLEPYSSRSSCVSYYRKSLSLPQLFRPHHIYI